jgi:2,3-bisphosphoglycerate-dependent phosphoglycerate mutase
MFLLTGESEWNKENRFTGWTDVPLSALGESEAKIAGKAILDHHINIDIAFTSVLKRAINTCNIVLDTVNQSYVPVIKTWRLNERHYGRLQGLNKSEVAATHGEQQVKIWRRSYDVPPPALDKQSSLSSDDACQYKKLPRDIVPLCESLKDTIERGK